MFIRYSVPINVIITVIADIVAIGIRPFKAVIRESIFPIKDVVPIPVRVADIAFYFELIFDLNIQIHIGLIWIVVIGTVVAVIRNAIVIAIFQ